MNIVKAKLSSLASPLGSADGSFTLNSLVDSKGNPITFAAFNATFFVVVFKSGDTTEMVKCSALVQNADGTVSVTIASSGRDIDPTSPYAGYATGQDFPAGADALITNDPLTMSRFVQLDNANIFTVTPSTTAGDPTDPTQLTRKAYVDALVLGTLTTIDVIVPGTAGATVAAGNLVYLDEPTGRWKLARADQVATVDNVLLGIAQGAGTNGTAIVSGVLLQGEDQHQSGMVAGTIMYASNTPGAISSTPGTEQTTIGVAKDATNLYFAPRFNMQLTKAGNDFITALPGMVFEYAGTSAPSGFLLADGSTVNNGDYPNLLAVLKGKYGVGTGTAFTANASTDVITATSHGLLAGQILLLDSTGTLPAGLSANTLYYVITVTTNTFQLSTSSGGSAVDITDTGSGTHSYHTQFIIPDRRGRVSVGAGTGTRVATFVSRSSNIITVSGLSNIARNEFQTGQLVHYSAPGGAMTGLTDNTDYYVIRVTNTTISLASTLANAQNGTAIALSSDGTGAQTFTLTLTARVNGDMGGEESHAMSATEILAHTHIMNITGGASNISTVGAPSGNTGGLPTSSFGGNAAMNNMQPFIGMTFIIKT